MSNTNDNDKASDYAFLFFAGALILSLLALVGMLFTL